MNKKKIVIITALVTIILILIGIIVWNQLYKNDNVYNEQINTPVMNTINQTSRNDLSESILENPAEAVLIEQNTSQEIIDTKEESNNHPPTEVTTQSNATTSKQSSQNEDVSKESSTLQEKSKELTVELNGEYDIKNGGSAQYSDWVEMPKDWLDY